MKTKIVILAAGKGTRMGSDLPKALVPLNGRPMIQYLADSVVAAGVDLQPIVVVSAANHDEIKSSLVQHDWLYAVQDQQLGTGHAVSSARSMVPEDTDNIVVLYCDHPFIKPSSIRSFAEMETESVTIMPAMLDDFEGWRQNFYHWGRIIRNAQGAVERIVEFKDASPAEIAVTEVNPGFMCLNKEWLFSNIDKLQDNNKAHEFYLTDMVKIAFNQGFSVGTIVIETHEAMGINSLDELKIAEGLTALIDKSSELSA
ncbi:MAG: NTP transferase domain-containing protein [bacterium]|nr:NTP transferase domain-containing protein [bacterium]